jgi:alkylation response protein AidB-like acyl-CoA dehydrogenase
MSRTAAVRQAIADFQNTQFKLADMATDLEAARALLYLAAAKVTAECAPTRPVSPRWPSVSPRTRICDGRPRAAVARRLWLSADYPIERFWRDLRVHSILEGTNEVMRMIIGRDLLRQ